MAKQGGSLYRLSVAIGFSCAVSICLLLVRIETSGSMRYSFLFWNLVLAIIPALLAVWLVRRVDEYGWMRLPQILLTIVWLSFLPNSFYLITDFIHLRETYEVSLLFDIVMLLSFVVNGLIFGFFSLYLVHLRLVKRFRPLWSSSIVALILLACSFATYLGRYTRWNSWDIVLRPAGLLFDVSDRFVNPSAHEQTYLTMLLFFTLLTSLYWVIWESTRLLRRK